MLVLKVYDPDQGTQIPFDVALMRMTPEWVESGHCCNQTTIDLLECCRKLMTRLTHPGTLAIQGNAQGVPVVVESVLDVYSEKQVFREVTAERWRQIVGEELDESECDRPIIPIQAAQLR
jgi:ADP-ribosylglycohydrolase